MNFIPDNSTQTGINNVTYTPTYSSVSNPNVIFNDSTSGIYNPTANKIIFYTSGTTALTIDSNQCLYGNATGLTHLQYTNIDGKPSTFPGDYNNLINKPSTFPGDYNNLINKPSTFPGDYNNLINKPTNFQSDYNSTVINKPDLSVYGTTTNLNNLSTNSILSINNLNATSTTLLGLVNGHTTSINNINATSTTLFTNLNNLSTNSILSINNLNATSTTLLGYLNTNNTAISNLNSTSTTILALVNGHTTTINNINTTSTTIFNNLNALSTNSTLTINNLNATSTTIFNNLNALSTNSTLSINNINATSTTIFNNLNALSTNSTLSINNLNATSTTIFNKTNFSNLIISGSSTFLSSLNVSGFTTLNNMSTILSSLNVSGFTTFNNNSTVSSSLNVSGNTTFQGASTLLSSLNVSGNATLNNVTTCLSSLNVSGITTLNNSVACNGVLNINGNSVVFTNVLSDYKITLWSPYYGFGINNSELKYLSSGSHNFYYNPSGTQTKIFGIDGSGNVSCTGAITNGSGSYIYAGGLRLGGFDTSNTIWNNNSNLGITTNNGYSVNIGLNGGKGGSIMTVNNNNVYINNSSLFITPDTTTRNAITMYCYPNGIYNSNGNSNSVNLRVACNTNPFTTSDFITVAVPDGWNGIDTIVTILAQSGANAGYSNGSRMILDGSINTNSSRGAYGSYIYWQSQSASGWITNMELYTNSSPILTTTLNVLGAVKSNSVTLTSSENIKTNIRDIYSPLDLIDSFSGKHYHNKLTGEKDFGLIAEEVEKLCPCLTSRYDDKGVDIGVKYMNLTALLIEGIKELKKRVEILENK